MGGIGIYLLFMLVPLAFGLYAQFRVKSAFNKYLKVGNAAGISGAEAAHEMLRTAGLERTVGIERHEGFLSDHYDPSAKVLRLSPDVYDGRSLASIGVACHEAGHALQDATHYEPLKLRNAIVPTASIGSNLGVTLIIIGMIFAPFRELAIVGLLLFSAVVIFQFINLPVEFNATARAKEMLGRMGIVGSPEESAGVAQVLDAAALTYVAATVSAVATLLYYGMMIFGGHRDE